MSFKHSMTIRIGAPYWDATLRDGTTFDFASMTSEGRRQWYRTFGDAVWKMFGHNDKTADLPKTKRKRVGRH